MFSSLINFITGTETSRQEEITTFLDNLYPAWTGQLDVQLNKLHQEASSFGRKTTPISLTRYHEIMMRYNRIVREILDDSPQVGPLALAMHLNCIDNLVETATNGATNAQYYSAHGILRVRGGPEETVTYPENHSDCSLCPTLIKGTIERYLHELVEHSGYFSSGRILRWIEDIAFFSQSLSFTRTNYETTPPTTSKVNVIELCRQGRERVITREVD